MKINNKTGLAIGAGLLSVGIFGAAGYAYFESSVRSAQTDVSALNVTSDTPAASPAPTSAPAAANPLHDLLKGLTDSAASYVGMKPVDLMTQLKAGKSLAGVASATTGRSRDGLVAALTSAASTKIDGAVADGTLSADQATVAKQKLSTEIVKLADRTGHRYPLLPSSTPTPDRTGPAFRHGDTYGAGVLQLV